MMNKVVLALATDNHYLKQTCVVIESAMQTAFKYSEYHFYILLNEVIRDDAENKFLQIQNRYENCSIKTIIMDGKLPKVACHIGHITSPTYYRLCLPNLLEEEKCIYLDSDVIVCRDLSGFYNMELDEYELAGVKAASWHTLKGEPFRQFVEMTGILSTDTYINAGVLLLNLRNMRKVNYVERALNIMINPFPCQDQDIINYLSYEKIKLLPLYYNVITDYVDENKNKKWENVFSNDEISRAQNDPYIIHYANEFKPWEFFDLKYANKWWEVCKKSIVYDEIYEEFQQYFYYYAIAKQRNNKVSKYEKFSEKWIQEIKKFSSIYVYGAGLRGEKVIKFLQEHKILIEAVLVSNAEENCKELYGIPVVEPGSDIDNTGLFILAVSPKHYVQIRRRLFQEGCFNLVLLDGY